MQGIEKCFRDDKGLVLASLNNLFFKYNFLSQNSEIQCNIHKCSIGVSHIPKWITIFFILFLNAFYNLRFNTKIF